MDLNEIITNNDITAMGRPRQHVGTYKQGLAKIRRLLFEGEKYDFSFSVISDWEWPVSVTANHSKIQANYHPT